MAYVQYRKSLVFFVGCSFILVFAEGPYQPSYPVFATVPSLGTLY